MPDVIASSAAERDYSKLLLRLHALEIEGREESEEADRIRDAMDAPWYAMNDVQREKMEHLSADLRAPVSVASPPQDWKPRARSAFESGNWSTLLLILRHVPVGPESLFLVARTWERLGLIEVALYFAEQAAQLDHRLAATVLYYLERLNRDTSVWATRVLDDPASGPAERYFGATQLFISMRQRDRFERDRLPKIASNLEKALRDYEESEEARTLFPGLASSIVSALGLCHQQMGDDEEALRVFTERIKRAPGDADVLLLRGLLLADKNDPAALTDFDGAVAAGSRSVWPWYFRARFALLRQMYWKCLEFTYKAMELTNHKQVLAQLQEWRGIAHLMTGQPADMVLEDFRQALELDPGSPRIEQNLILATQTISSGVKEKKDWPLPALARKLSDDVVVRQSNEMYQRQGELALSSR